MAWMQDYSDIVKKVVEEVVRRLGETGAGAVVGGRAVGGGLVGGAVNPAGGAPVVGTGCAVCVLCGKCVEKVPEAVEKIKGAGAARISSSPGVASVGKDVAPLIDHTLLKPDASRAEI
jgi:copper chaperone CopZ